MEKQKFKHLISLGATCLPRIIATRQGFKPTIEQGELAMPFDLAGHRYEGVCDILEAGFEDYCNPDYFKMGKDAFDLPIVSHTKYDMWFAHEIHGSRQKFFTDNNYAMLCALYKRRIENFYKCIDDGDILFLTHHREYPQRLNQVLKAAFPELNYKIVALTTFAPSQFAVDDFYPVESYEAEVDYHCISFPTDEYEWLWWQAEHYESEMGMKFEDRIGDILSKYVDRVNPRGTAHTESQD